MHTRLLLSSTFVSLAFAMPVFASALSPVACTMEAKMCPDGVTYVGRQGPNCEFAACPTKACTPYMCADGTKVARCAADGTTINYFAAPCMTHGGEVGAASFSDVSNKHPNAEAIAYVKAGGIVEGYPDGTFKPDRTINRAEFAKILDLMEDGGSDCSMGWIESGTTPFYDVKADDWFSPFLCVLHARGIISGYPDGTFRPAADISFVEAAKIIGASADPNDDIIPPREDGDEWYVRFVRYLASKNAIPTSITRFDQNITRGEMAEMIWRLKSGITTKPSQTYEQLSSMIIPDRSDAQWGSWSENGYFFHIPNDWKNAQGRDGKTIFVDNKGVVRAGLTCPIPEAGFEAWDFQESHRTFTDHGQLFGATMWLGNVREDATGLTDLNIVFMHHNTFDHWFDAGDAEYSCMLTSEEGALDNNVWKSIYNSVEVLSE